MAQTNNATRDAASEELPPLLLSRVLHARRATVFRAWSTAEHVKRWFAPETYTIPEATVEFREGGRFELCMRSPAGEGHWLRGTFIEVTPHTRLVIDMGIADETGTELFRALTEVDFVDALGGTQMDVTQRYTLLDPSKAWMIKGAPEGWRSTLDKLEKEVVGMQGGAVDGKYSVVHATFHIERRYDAPIGRVWKALTDQDAKAKWFAYSPGKLEVLERHTDVRPGGSERVVGRWQGGVVSTFDALYHDVIPNERLLYTYEMHLDDRKISVSLATIQLKAADGKTTVSITEQGAFLDGYDDAGSREQGTGFLLDTLGASLAN